MQELIQGLDKVMVGESWNARTKNKVLSYTTRNGVIKTLKRLYTFAIKNGLYDGQNNAENLQLFKVDNAVENILPEEDFKRLIGVIRNWDNKIVSYAFLFCLYSGKRAGEVFGLTWDRVDFQTKNFVFLVKSQNKNKKQYYPMNQMLEKFVLNAKDEYNGSDTQFVFPTKQGKRILYGRSWTRIKKKAKIEKDFRVHDLRHTFATLLASSGKITMRELQFLLGHSTIAMTERYAHFFDSAIQKTVKVSGDVISESLDF
jgi:integrase